MAGMLGYFANHPLFHLVAGKCQALAFLHTHLCSKLLLGTLPHFLSSLPPPIPEGRMVLNLHPPAPEGLSLPVPNLPGIPVPEVTPSPSTQAM